MTSPIGRPIDPDDEGGESADHDEPADAGFPEPEESGRDRQEHRDEHCDEDVSELHGGTLPGGQKASVDLGLDLDQGFPPKEEWGEGPWQHEPDELAWSFGDVACRIVRHPRFGSLNGYVGIPPGHPWYERDAEEIEADVHGGLTFAGRFNIATHATATDALWWVGFDTSHFRDFMPGMVALERRLGMTEPFRDLGTYKDLGYVRSETENLARQAIGAMR